MWFVVKIMLASMIADIRSTVLKVSSLLDAWCRDRLSPLIGSYFFSTNSIGHTPSRV